MGLIRTIKSQFSAGGLFVLRLVVVVGALLLLNLGAYLLQFDWDASEGRLHSLADSTLEILARVEVPIHILFFDEKPRERADVLLQRFRKHCKSITWEFVSFTKEEELVAKYEVKRPGLLVVTSGDNVRLARLDEQHLAGVILQLAKGGGKKVLFSKGHGERDPTGLDEDGLGKAYQLVGGVGYTPEEADLTPESLADASVVVIAAPKAELGDALNQELESFVRGGGGLLVLLDPPPAAGLNTLLARFDVVSYGDMVIELSKSFRHTAFGADTVYVRQYSVGQPVADRVNQSIMLRRIRSLGLLAAPDGSGKDEDAGPGKADAATGRTDAEPESAPTQEPSGEEAAPEEKAPHQIFAICKSSPNSWGETNLQDRKAEWNEGEDLRGPRPLIVATAEPPTAFAGDGRLMVVGASGMATNRYIDTAGNREFFEAAVSWLAGDLDYPLIAQKEPEKKLDLTDVQLRRIFAVCVLFIPGLIGLLGLGVVIRRTRRSN